MCRKTGIILGLAVFVIALSSAAYGLSSEAPGRNTDRWYDQDKYVDGATWWFDDSRLNVWNHITQQWVSDQIWNGERVDVVPNLPAEDHSDFHDI